MNKMNKLVSRISFLVLFCATMGFYAKAQINTVEYGRTKVQYKKFKWKYFQTKNFNIYYTDKTKFLESDNNNDVTKANRSDNNELIAKYVAQIAEANLPEIENNAESGLQRRVNIILYNSYNDYKQSNIGQGIDWQIPGGTTKLVNNKIAVYFNSDHENLKFQVREAIARVLVDNVLFGDDIGEIARNQALLDLPEWLVDGYVKYLAQNWSTDLDDELKSALLSGTYRTFYQFAFDKPLLAGHSFWRYIEDNYKKENVTYFFYLTRVYKNLNSASEKICKKKFKLVLQDFMEKESEKYYEDIRKRKNNPRGKLFTQEEVGKKDFFKFQANPAPKSQDYAVVEYKKGVYKVYLVEGWIDKKLLLKFGARTNYKAYNNQYPLLAWDPKGTRLSVMYSEKGKIRLFIFDAVRRFKIEKTSFPSFDQVQDMNYMSKDQLLFSAVRNGQSDIYSYNLSTQKLEQITNDVYADLDPTFVTFPSKTGIIYSSNRPQPESISNDTVVPNAPYNIYLVDDWNKSEFKKLSKLTNVKFGNARYPSQYNSNHFTFVNDEKGVANRYAGFFNSTAAGYDTLIYVGSSVLHNPSLKDVDSLLAANKQEKPDSVGYFRVTDDSTYTFPISNYESGIVETRMSGDKDQISETRREGDYKLLYKLKVDEDKLKRRNVNIRPTAYMERLLLADRIARGEAINNNKTTQDSSKKASNDLFQTEFTEDSTTMGKIFDAEDPETKENILVKAKQFPYQLKFSTDYLTTGFNNNILVNKYRPFNFGQYTGSNGVNPNPLNAMTRFGISDLMEDIKFIGAFRTPTSLNEFEWLFNFQNNRRRLDWGLTYYRQTYPIQFPVTIGSSNFSATGKYKSNLYQANLGYAFAETKALRFSLGLKYDYIVINAQPDNGNGTRLNPPGNNFLLKEPNFIERTGLAHLEYVQDYTLNPTQNIHNGLRWKVYLDANSQLNKDIDGRFTYVFGGDARHYLPIYRHIIWATRAAADFSWGNRKVVYYLGGVDQAVRLLPNQKTKDNQLVGYRYFNEANTPADDVTYAYEAFSQNLRGFLMNTANGNNVVVLNSEIRVPIFSTFFSRPVNNAFLRNLQFVQFFDLGTAWNGKYNGIKRPTSTYSVPGNPVSILVKAGGIGPFAGSYGFGVRSVLLGYFVRFDAGWQMNGFFKGKPVIQIGTGFDF
jgi:hypothetical protein